MFLCSVYSCIFARFFGTFLELLLKPNEDVGPPRAPRFLVTPIAERMKERVHFEPPFDEDRFVSLSLLLQVFLLVLALLAWCVTVVVAVVW